MVRVASSRSGTGLTVQQAGKGLLLLVGQKLELFEQHHDFGLAARHSVHGAGINGADFVRCHGCEQCLDAKATKHRSRISKSLAHYARSSTIRALHAIDATSSATSAACILAGLHGLA